MTDHPITDRPIAIIQGWRGLRSVRRSIGVAIMVAAWVTTGPWLTMVAIAGTLLISFTASVVGSSGGSRKARSRRAGATVSLAGTAWALAGLTALVAPAARVIRAAHQAHSLREASVIVLAHGHGAVGGVLSDLLVLVALISSFLAVRTLRPGGWRGRGAGQEELNRARALVEQYGEDSLSPFILRPDKSFEFGRDAVLAYRPVAETAVVSGDPIGPNAAVADLLAQFLRQARQREGRVAVYGASERHLDTYRALGLRAMCVGVEAVVRPEDFTLEGRAVRKLRQSVHRVERRGWAVSVCDGREIDAALESEIDAVESAWRAEQPSMLGFAMSLGEYDLGIRPRDLYLLARSPDGRLQAVMRFLWHRGRLSLDMMRRIGETPNGLNEALVCAALRFARERGIPEVSLNYAGLGHLVLHGPTGNRLLAPFIRIVLGRLGARFQMDRLVLFNQKFSPHWRPRYLIYESRMSLPRAVFRVLQAEGYVPSRVRPRARRDVGLWQGASSATSVGGRLG